MEVKKMSADEFSVFYLRITDDLDVLIEDDNFWTLVEERKRTDDKKKAARYGLAFANKAVAYLLRIHKAVLYNIVGALLDKDSDEIGKMAVPELVKPIYGLISDKRFMDFFPQSGESEQETQSDT